MIVKQYIKDFENLEFGMFVHFGLYSVIGRGEWNHHYDGVVDEEYMQNMYKFDPDPDWAEELVLTAKAAGCKYITLTTRHHDGFSLYDASPVSDYDAPHGAAGRDLVREFVDACNRHGIKPFFYHTLLDWHVKSYNENFPEYLKYLRSSVEILCTRYGEIGGIWFDGMWNKPDADWEEDALYGMIRSHQPNAMIINNTGMSAKGALGHIELDSVTFERGRPRPINQPGAPKYIASEMCQIFAAHWGYTARDFNFKSLATIIEDLCVCRRYGANFLLNVGPMGNGLIRALDSAMLLALGEWVDMFGEAIYKPDVTDIKVLNKEKDFLLRGDNCYYLFCHDMNMGGSANVVDVKTEPIYCDTFKIPEKIKRVSWVDSGKELEVRCNDGEYSVITHPFAYGEHLVVRVAKIEI